MTTVQQSPNGHRVFPPPCPIENPAELNRADPPTSKANINSNPPPVEIDTNPLPERCQFTFSDGRQCSMARSDIHPSLCRYHSEREQQLFGSPVTGGNVVGAALDLPELYSACRDLTTATGVNRALAQVFRLLAQRRISRQEAATFGHLAQLLLRTISLMRAEADHATSKVAPSDEPQVVIPPQLSPQHKDGASARQPAPISGNSSAPPTAPAAPSEPLARPTAVKTSSGMNTCAAANCNSSEINTYENDDPIRIVVPSERSEPRDLSQEAQNEQIRSIQLEVT